MDVAPKVYCAVCVFEDKHQAEENAIKGKVKLGAAGGKYQHCLISFIAAAIVCVSHCFVLVPEGESQTEGTPILWKQYYLFYLKHI